MNKELFRKLPKVDKLLAHPELEELSRSLNYHDFSQSIKSGVEFFRTGIQNGTITDFSEDEILIKIKELGKKNGLGSLRRVFNGTGTIIHTNLGRSLFTEKMMKHVSDINTNYNNLEYDLEKGARGSRYSHLEELICKVTGAESALVVNNNAAAVILCLNEFSKGKEAIVSRGELVEIGGSFRIPDIMELSGTKLREVGTTNRTHLKDYERAIGEDTALILKIHASNYKMLGFTSSVSVEEIAQLSRKHDLISMEDIGSGVLVDFSKYGVTKEPTVQESIAAGADIVTFSGDKLLGGPQAGIIVGKKHLIDRLLKNQYLRAFRMNKSSIAALEMTFRYYLDEREAVRTIPTLKMILEPSENVLERANSFSLLLEKLQINHKIIPTRAKIGGGSMPEETVESHGISLPGNPNKLEERFRKNEPPVIGRIYQDQFVLDMKTISEKDFEELVGIIENIIAPKVV
ncbi:MAG: L-seryl-tRNA(Sec) selenium transferase [Fusobacteriaceae bacterium]